MEYAELIWYMPAVKSISPGISPGLLLQYSFRSNADHVVHALDEVVTLYTWMHRAALGLSGPVVHEKTHLHRSRSFQMPLEDVEVVAGGQKPLIIDNSSS